MSENTLITGTVNDEVAVTPTDRLAAFVAGIDVSAVEDVVWEAAKILVLDGVGVLVAGARHPAVAILRRYVSAIGGRPECTVTGDGQLTNAPLAAFLNGAMIHVNDFEAQGAVPTHGTSNLLPPALALAERTGAGGQEVLAAIVCGWEIQSRLRASGPVQLGGFHPPGVFGPLGAAAVSGRLLGLSAEEMAMAFGIAASRSAGLFANNGTMMKSTHPAHAGRMGVESALLAQLGFDANPDILGAPRGFVTTLFRGQCDSSILFDGIERAEYLVRPGFSIKRYPAEIYMQRVIESTAALRRQAGFSVDRLVELTIELNPLRDDLLRPSPKSGLDGKFSYEYCAAVGVAEDEVSIESFSDEICFSDRIQSVLGRIRIQQLDDIPSTRDDTWVSATAQMSDGRRLKTTCKDFRGSRQNPMTREERLQKFRQCTARGWSEHQVDEAIDVIDHLETDGALPRLIELLRDVAC